MKDSLINPGKQKKRLRWLLLLLFTALSIPVYYLLQTVYQQLENEAYFNARHQAETLVDQIDLKLQLIMEKEQNRPIAEYKFFNVMENPLLSETSGVKFSPLSEIPPKTDIKGLVGYFQIDTDGSFHLPTLPEVGQDNLSGLSLAELENRLKLKHQLRNLLSIKISEKPQAKADVGVKTRDENIANADDSHQPYMEEFKQQVHSADDVISSEKRIMKIKKKADKLGASNFYIEGRLQQNLNKAGQPFRTRKEIVQIPDQTMASSYFNKSKQRQKEENSELKKAESTKDDSTFETEENSDSAVNVFSFESEVTPLQMLIIGKKYLCFYRYVWHDNNRYTQGFIVKGVDFLTSMTEELIRSTDYNSMLFSSNGNILYEIKNNISELEYPLYGRQLSMPFQKLKLDLNATKITGVPGAILIDLIALSIYCILFIGLIAIYRLGIRQIDLAKQQQNFISAVSHELKTPLTSIRMYGEMLRSGWVKDETKIKSYYDFIFFESERLSRLIENVLQLARLDHQIQHKAEVVTMTAQALLNQIPKRVEAQIAASSFSLKTLKPEKSSEQSEIRVNEDAFFQIVINLVDNAIKFAAKSDNHQIDIGYIISENGKNIYFTIRDYGPGIKKDQIKKIFQLFYRSGDELTRTTPGTGIGLALVAQLAESMGATINVINKQPGIEFQIKLQKYASNI